MACDLHASEAIVSKLEANFMTARKLEILSCLAILSFGFGFATGNAQPRSGVAAEDAPAPRAIQCSAAMELMARAAPQWSSAPVAQEARAIWRNEAYQLAASAGRNANTEIGQEMGLLAEQAVTNPDALSQIAAQCVGDAPGATQR